MCIRDSVSTIQARNKAGEQVELSAYNAEGEYDTSKNPFWLRELMVVAEGVRIGHHAIIGAGSVVLHDVEARAVMIKAPACLLYTSRCV